MNKTWYLAGPMSGIPQFNFPAFETAAEYLRQRGMNVISPTELDSPEWYAAAVASPDGDVEKAVELTKQTWGEIMGRDVRHVADDCDGIILLPGWEKSRGARLEAFVAITCGKSLLAYIGYGACSPVTKGFVLGEIRYAMEGP